MSGVVAPAVDPSAKIDPKTGKAKCCPCATNMSPCGCATTVTVQCRGRSGRATLCGLSEYQTPTNPPKKFKREEYSGTILQTCSGGTTRVTLGGACTAAPQGAYCTFSSTGFNRFDYTGGKCLQSGADGVNNPMDCLNAWPFTQSTRIQRTYGGGDFGVGAVGMLYADLQSEDTESDAMKRSNAVWSTWQKGAVINRCCAFKTLRGPTEFSFGFAESELKLTAKGQPNAVQKVEITFEQQPLSGGQIQRQPVEVEIHCDGAGDGEQTISVPNVAGLQTCWGGIKLL